jgi:hypothetical protein
MSAKDSFQCACNDNSYRIISQRQKDTWQTQGFWCSTIMTFLNYDGSTKYVWNPFSLEELELILNAPSTKANLNVLDFYLECIATGGTQCSTPSNIIFDRQQVVHNIY